MKTIYFDNAATTPMLDEVVEAVNLINKEIYGNPSGVYADGMKAKKILTDARKTIAGTINCKPEEVYFTSGGCEGDNWILKGVMSANRNKGNHLIVSSIEHHAIIESAKWLSKNGCDVTFINPDKNGIINPSDIEAAIKDSTVLISVMYVNNETGMIQPIEEIGEIAAKHNVLFHTDAVQAYGKISIDVSKLKTDFLTASAHKFHGPKGVGFAYVKAGTNIDNLIHGGTQERGLRAGTENVSAIYGMAKACEIAHSDMSIWREREEAISGYIYNRLTKEIDGIKLNGLMDKKIPGIMNFSIRGVEGETMLIMLDMKHIAVSTGSACAVKLSEPSHVLTSMGLNIYECRGSVRLSLSGQNTMEEAEYFCDVFCETVKYLINLKLY